MSDTTTGEVRSENEDRHHIDAGLAELDAGRGIPHEDVEKWLESWGTEDEFPPQQ